MSRCLNFDSVQYKKVLEELLIQVKYPKDKKKGKICKICLASYNESDYNIHKMSESHLNFIKLNDKLRKLNHVSNSIS